MKKRIYVLVMSVISLLLLAACSGLNDDNSNPIEFTRGQWYDGVYTNTFANLSFRLPDGWGSTHLTSSWIT